MIDDDLIGRLQQLHDHLPAPATSPQEDARRGERLLRRRRTAAVAGVAAAVVATFGVARIIAPDGDSSTPEPAPSPTTTNTSAADAWTPERIRQEGEPDTRITRTASGLSATQYYACAADPCVNARFSLEVAQGEDSAVFEVRGELPTMVPVWVAVYDDDSVLVQDGAGQPGDAVRYRILRADGSATELTLDPEPAPAVPGPQVFVITDYATWVRGYATHDDMFFVDEETATIRPLDVPDDAITSWSSDEAFLWGVGEGCLVVWTTGERLEETRLDCNEGLRILDEGGGLPAGWQRPGRMAALEVHDVPGDNREDVNEMTVHLSLDAGATWNRVDAGIYDDDTWTADVMRAVAQHGSDG